MLRVLPKLALVVAIVASVEIVAPHAATRLEPSGVEALMASRTAPATPVRYPEVEPIFAKHCANCHDARKASNPPAQAVFEMSRYPFATKRPTTLIDDLRAMVPKRGALSADDKILLEDWLAGGALDANGQSPCWRR